MFAGIWSTCMRNVEYMYVCRNVKYMHVQCRVHVLLRIVEIINQNLL